jgi:hypothetical protein
VKGAPEGVLWRVPVLYTDRSADRSIVVPPATGKLAGATTRRPGPATGVTVRDSDLPAFWGQMSDERAQHMAAVTRGYHYDRAAFGAHWGKVRSDPVVIVRKVLADGEVAATRRSSARRASGRSPLAIRILRRGVGSIERDSQWLVAGARGKATDDN